MSYEWLIDLDAALDAAGVPYVEVMAESADYTGSSTWRERGRPASTGPFNPSGVLCHHTASPAGTSDQADLNAILWGNSQAPGPISTIYIGRTGVVYLVAAGRCNHGGKGVRPGVDDGCADMNAHLLGIEAGNNGVGERWPTEQTAIYAATVAALCAWYGWSVDRDVYLHATTGPPSGGCNSKIDPAGPWDIQPQLTGSTTWDLDLWRAYCATANVPPIPEPEPEPEPSEPEDDDDMAKTFLVAHPETGGWYCTDMATYKTHVGDPELGREGAALWGWVTADGAGTPFGLGAGWGPFLDLLETRGPS